MSRAILSLRCRIKHTYYFFNSPTQGRTGLPFNYTMDCNNVCNGSAFVDDCGKCVLSTKNGSSVFKDCHGECFGKAVKNKCGFCVKGGTGLPENHMIDACGKSLIYDDITHVGLSFGRCNKRRKAPNKIEN